MIRQLTREQELAERLAAQADAAEQKRQEQLARDTGAATAKAMKAQLDRQLAELSTILASAALQAPAQLPFAALKRSRGDPALSPATCASAEMPEYAQTVGPAAVDPRQRGLHPGDPRKAAQTILVALDADEPPLRLVLGDDVISGVRSRLDRLSAELATWEDVGPRTTIALY